MAKIKLTLPGMEIPVDGKQVTFVAPCDCSVADGIQIDGVDYDIVDSIGKTVSFGKGVWDVGAVLTVSLDVTNRKAYLQNQNGYTKAETLTDATKIMYGLTTAATPDTLFQKLGMPPGYYGFDITTVFEDGTPVPYVVLNGLEDLVGNTAMTDANGRCYLCVTKSSELTVPVSGYIGVVDKEETISAREGYVVTPVTIVLERDLEVRLIRSSGTLRVLPGSPVDMCIVGGGAGGNRPSSNETAGAGGAGGSAKNILGVVLNDIEIDVTIGAGGAAGYGSNPAGGASSVTYNGVVESAEGGQGGANGVDGTVRVFNDDTLPLPGGSGGRGGSGAAGGKDFGGAGCITGSGSYTEAQGGRGPGGGGGGGYYKASPYNYGLNLPAAAGAAGGLYIRVNHGSEVQA